MNTSLIHYLPTIAMAGNPDVPGITNFSFYFRIYNPSVVPIDRTGTIRFPVRTTSLFPLPKMRPFHKSYEAICNTRAQELLRRANERAVSMYVFWSGGIDSTLALISILKHATLEEIQNTTILMSEESIAENPNFYREHIHGKIKTESSNRFPYLVGGRHLIVNGEHNDQLFGSDAILSFIERFGEQSVHEPYSREKYFIFFNQNIQNETISNKYLNLFEKLAAAAPIRIERNFDFLWWINFALKWQNVSLRSIAFTAQRNRPLITREYFNTFYAPFYNTEEFQLWSMLNPDKKIKDSWTTYKWEAKQVIYGFTKDAEYRDHKVKRGSLARIIAQQRATNFIDNSFHFHDTIDAEAYLDLDNDFV